MPDRQKARKWKMNAGGNGYRPDQVAPDGALPPGEEEPMLPGASPHRPEGNVFVDPPHMTPAEELSYAAEEMEKESVLETECPDPFQVLQSDLEAALRDLAKERASFANYRQRIDKEKEEIRRYGGLELARDLVRVLDYFQMSLQFDAPDLPPAAQNLMQGVQYTVGELERVLASHGVTPIPVVIGAPIDPGSMEAIATEVRPDAAPGTVLAVQTPGYRFKDRILRPARVTVAVVPEAGPAE